MISIFEVFKKLIFSSFGFPQLDSFDTFLFFFVENILYHSFLIFKSRYHLKNCPEIQFIISFKNITMILVCHIFNRKDESEKHQS